MSSVADVTKTFFIRLLILSTKCSIGMSNVRVILIIHFVPDGWLKTGLMVGMSSVGTGRKKI